MRRLLALVCCLFALGSAAFVAQAEEQPLTTKTVKSAVRELLDEFDSFKDTAAFKQCVYGCGSENPAAVWNAKRDALNKQMTPPARRVSPPQTRLRRHVADGQGLRQG